MTPNLSHNPKHPSRNWRLHDIILVTTTSIQIRFVQKGNMKVQEKLMTWQIGEKWRRWKRCRVCLKIGPILNWPHSLQCLPQIGAILSFGSTLPPSHLHMQPLPLQSPAFNTASWETPTTCALVSAWLLLGGNVLVVPRCIIHLVESRDPSLPPRLVERPPPSLPGN